MKNIFKLNYLLYAVLTLFIFTACEEDEAAPEEENEVEVFTDVKLVFTPAGGGAAVEAAAQDPDGAGVQELQVLGAINLAANTSYTLTMVIENCLESPCELMNEEIEEEDEEHQFFFAFSDDAFTSPAGNGNVDSASDPLNYNDVDGNDNSIGLNTSWTTGVASSGTFTVRLQHQPDVKTDTSGATDGDTDFALTFNLNIN
ncbi:MAG: GTP cyclohydrolase [Flammeovirgaceae bacterium]|nr:GTP cyclohydrolase [Flammeovirgaceae bacterium]